jgi:uncharacterized DUF497 family protein
MGQMQIESILCPEHIEAKLEAKHGVTYREARQALLGRSRIRFAEKGRTEGEDVHACFGQTLGGRYLAVFFIYKPTSKTAVIISAREMNERERRTYGRK